MKLGDGANITDEILFDNKSVRLPEKIVIMLHKPAGFVTTASETHGMKTVFDLVRIPQRVFPIGRLDKNTEGLLLLTNDGDLANRLTHPRYEVKKEYFVVVDRPISDSAIEKLEAGIEIDGREVNILSLNVKGKEATLVIHEGRKHVVRRLFEEVGLKVVKLARTKIAELTLGDLPKGKWRKLEKKEIQKLA